MEAEASRGSRSIPDQPTKAMLLAAGQGTRLRPLTATVPKCMVPIAGKPVLEWNIEWLRRYGVTDLVINLCYMPRAVIDYFGDGSRWNVRITYSIEETPLGTAGGVRRVAGFFDRTFFVWYGDNLSTCDLDRLYRSHRANRANGALATIALYYREDPTASGIVGLDREDRIQRFLEKPRAAEVFSHWVNAGILVLEPTLLETLPADEVLDFGKDVFPAALANGQPLSGYRMSPDEGLWWIDTAEDLRRVQEVAPVELARSLTTGREPESGVDNLSDS